jgi:natural product biosynthesis luciferase-like monooxygenase protein
MSAKGERLMGNHKCVLVGDALLLVRCAEILLAKGHHVALVVTEHPQIRSWAASQSIQTVEFVDVTQAVEGLAFDWLFSIANLRVLPAELIRRPKGGAINFHDALLPDQAGLNTPAWAILEGRERHGVTWHALTAEVDQGGIYIQRSFAIENDDTALTLNSKCFSAGAESFGDVLEMLERGDKAQPQPTKPLRVYKRSDRPVAAATLDFSQPAVALDRLFRALDWGSGYANPLMTPKVRHGGDVFRVRNLRILDRPSNADAGTVLAVEGDVAVIATADQPMAVEATRQHGDKRITLASKVRVGEHLPLLSAEEAERLTAAVAAITPFEQRFVARLAQSRDLELPDIATEEPHREPRVEAVPLAAFGGLKRAERAALIFAFLARVGDQTVFDLAFCQDKLFALNTLWPGYFSRSVPLRVDVTEMTSPRQLIEQTTLALAKAEQELCYLADLPDRHPDLQRPALTFGILEGQIPLSSDVLPGCAITFRIGESSCELLYDRHRVSAERAHRLAKELQVLGQAFVEANTDLADLPLMSRDEQDMVVYGWNQTALSCDQDACVHHLIERQVQITPSADAVCDNSRTLTYDMLNSRADALAGMLMARGVGPETVVGIHLPRTVDLVVAVLGIWKAGGAYLPLDPEFPSDRLAFMIEDSGADLVVCNRELSRSSALDGCSPIIVEDLPSAHPSRPREHRNSKPGNLAYVIYTSGSTGKPKGVMIEHRNVVNFFAGMDQRVPVAQEGHPEEPRERSVWLAVTSLSFDISVLELFWTLSRGFKVVLHTPEIRRTRSPVRTETPGSDLTFGLFYWGNDASAGPHKYRLLIEGAKFADANGFDAVWTPERHFHAFGGPFPNPSVSSAAVAAVTSRIAIRAGSCVLPLHHPIRVAEEWAVVDNLSNGRVGLAFASGWMPEDFVLRPENAPPNNKKALFRDIDVVRRLWRGESVSFAGAGDAPLEVVTQPRPVQPELPVWVTTAGNPDSFREAARLGAHVLTHLLGQSIDDLAQNIRIYRKELTAAGRDPSAFKVSLMLHTLIGEDRQAVRQLAQAPLKAYLKSAAALIKQYAWAFPAFKKPAGSAHAADIDLRSLEPEEMDAILDFAFQRYFEDSGLFGTQQDAARRLSEVKAAGVDDIACLIDWGLPEDVVLDGLKPLAAIVSRTRIKTSADVAGFAEDVIRHKVTHLQSTPSMMRAFMMSEEDERALKTIRHLLLGGEALPGALVAALRQCTDATIDNMYGPTETTIWSSTYAARSSDGVAPIGTAIANTQLYVLDRALRPVAPGEPGELYIGGDGVARGYLNREALTGERFLQNPFTDGRIYRTGDLARFDDDGILHFLGRNDHQVKIRGHRIELGEIEEQICRFPGVVESVVIAREKGPGDVRLVAYVRSQGSQICEQSLKEHLRQVLPESMLPSDVVTLTEFPLTPNAKVDRSRLPPPTPKIDMPSLPFLAPDGELEKALSAVFARTLGRDRVGRMENFFSIGGHSLLAVQMHRELKTSLAPDLTITDLFRFPTVATLAGHIAGPGAAASGLGEAASRAAQRRQLLLQRQGRSHRADVLA